MLDDRATCGGQIWSLKDSLRGSAHLAKDDLGELADHHAFLSLPAWEIETFLHDIAQIEQALPGFAGREGPSTRAQAAQREIRQAWEGLSNAKVRGAGDHSDNSGPPKAWLAARRHGGRAPFAHKRDSPQPGSWHALPEMQHTVRFVRGLKGTMSEAELHILKQRMHQGRLSKAQRGELQFALPVGYVWSPTGEIQFDPDEQVQQVVRLLFRTFEDLGTLGGLVRYLAQHQIQLGVRVREGPGKGELVWRRPNRATLQTMLKHPLYAGSYVYGRRQDDPRRKQPERPRTGRVVMETDEWLVLLPNHCPAYISPEQYERNQLRLQANRARADAMGAARNGSALLAGLVVCARCGCRLTVHYDDGDARLHTYECVERWTHYGEPRCQHLAGPCLDVFVSQQVLTALEPAALELSLSATARLEQERAELDLLWQQRRERAAYEVERAARQYQAVEPEHRLVARTLERAWEEKLLAQQQLEEEYHRFLQQKPRILSETEREAIRRLATDIPVLWAAATTTDADRKEIIRQVVERVIVDVQGSSERVKVRIEWIGGGSTESVVIRPVRKLSQLSTYPQICQRVQELTEAGWAATAIAQALSDEGYGSARAMASIGKQTVRQIQRHVGVKAPRPRSRSHQDLLPDEWWPAELARTLHIPRASLHHWIRQGLVRARQLDEPLHRWVVWADQTEQERLRQYHQRAIGDDLRHRWTEAPLAEQPE